MAYFCEHRRPRKVQCSSPSALSGIVDRNGMGDFGKLPIELVIEVLKHIPFRQRLKTTLLVSKSFQGLVHEKSLWKTVEVDRALEGLTLANMIQPNPLAGCPPAEPLIPKGNVEELTIDMSYCTTGNVIGLIKRLQWQKHALTSLSMIGTWPLLNSTVVHLCKQIRRNEIDFTQITNFSLTGGPGSCFYLPLDEVGELLASMPKLLHVRIDGKQYRNTPHVKVDESILRRISNPSTDTYLEPDIPQGGLSNLKTLIVPFWIMSLAAMVQLGTFFPELETIELGMTASCQETVTSTFAPLPALRSAKIVYHADSKHAHAGVSEEKISKYFIDLVANAPTLQELSFSDESHAFSKKSLDLFKWAKHLYQGDSKGLESPHLRNVILKGWAPIGLGCTEGMKKFWRCPNLLDAPWLFGWTSKVVNVNVLENRAGEGGYLYPESSALFG